MVSVRIHCTEKWRTSFHTDVLSKSKSIFLRVFFICTQKVIHHFPAPIFPDLRMPGYPQKASYLSTDSVTKFLQRRSGLNLEISFTDNICDRVSAQSKKLKDAILVAFDRGKCGLENGV